MAKSITLRDRIRYRVDGVFIRGPRSLILWLVILLLLLVISVSSLVLFLGIGPVDHSGGSLSTTQTIWYSLMRTLDPGTMGGDEGSWPFSLPCSQPPWGASWLSAA